MTATPDISILLPVRNGASTLPAALESLQTQTFKNWEALVVDDGSTDNTPALIREAVRADPRFRPLHQPPLGIVAALNHAFAHARAPLIARIFTAATPGASNRLAKPSSRSSFGLLSGRIRRQPRDPSRLRPAY